MGPSAGGLQTKGGLLARSPNNPKQSGEGEENPFLPPHALWHEEKVKKNQVSKLVGSSTACHTVAPWGTWAETSGRKAELGLINKTSKSGRCFQNLGEEKEKKGNISASARGCGGRSPGFAKKGKESNQTLATIPSIEETFRRREKEHLAPTDLLFCGKSSRGVWPRRRQNRTSQQGDGERPGAQKGIQCSGTRVDA